MRIRTFTLVAVLSLVVVACNPGGETAETTTSVSAETTSTAADPEAILLSYSLEAGQSFTYEVDLDQTIGLAVEGDASALGEEEEIPERLEMSIVGTTTFTHSVADGPEPGTYTITITGDLSGLEFTGTMDGEPVTQEDIPDFAATEQVDVTIVVDEMGNIIPDESGLGEDFFGDLGGLDMLSQMGSGAGVDSGQFIGPPFTEEEVTVGDTWSETVETPTLPGDDPITSTIQSEVVGIEEIGGAEVFVIETTTSTSAIEFDLAQLLIGFLTAFVPDDASDEDRAEIDAIVDQLRFAFTVDPQVAEMTTWFDYEAGMAVQSEFASTTHMTMDINVPDEESGEMVEMAMDMAIDQNITYRLLGVGDGGDA